MLSRTWALAAVVVAAGPLFAAEPNSDQPKPVPDLKAIQDRMDRLDETIRHIDVNLTRLVEANLSAMQKDVGEMRELVASLRREIADLRNAAVRDSYTARKPIESFAATVTLVNENPNFTMNALVNGELHTLPPGSSRALPVPAGAVQIQVRETDAVARMRMLQPRENKIVTMH